MKRQEMEKELRRLIRSKNNDAVKLAYLGAEDLQLVDQLDLQGVTEFKRSEKGGFEVKFVDKLKVLELLKQLSQRDEEGALDSFLEGLQDGGAG